MLPRLASVYQPTRFPSLSTLLPIKRRLHSMASLRFLSLSLATGLFTGCATYQTQDLKPAATQAQLERRSLADAGLARYLNAHGSPVTPGATEWDLPRLTLAAFYFSPALELARAEFAGAEARTQTASARPNPTFTFTPGRSDNTTGGLTPWILGYALQLPVELGGKRGHRVTEAQRQRDAARLALASQAWSLHSAVRRAIVDLQAAEAEAELWRAQLPLATQTARLADAQVEAGDGSPLEAARARAAAAQSELAARASERATTEARSRLAEVMGLPLAALADVRIAPLGVTEASPRLALTEARTWAAQNRADLLAALATYAATESALHGEIARQYPDLTLGPGYQLDQGEGKWSVGLGFTLPVFHQNQGPIAAAEARRAAASAQFLAVQNRVLAEVDRAAANYTSTFADLATVRGLRATLERQTALVRARHGAGDSSRLDLARAELDLAGQAQIELAARQRAQLALGALEDAVQRPLAWPESAWAASARLTELK